MRTARDDEKLAWQNDARCTQIDPEVWFPERGRQAKDAKAECAKCPVAAECLEYGVVATWVQDGIWGGKGPAELREIRKQRRMAGAELPEGWEPNGY